MEYLTENLGNDVRELLLFKLDDTIYAIDSCKISEILRLMKLEIPEKLPENAIGILEFNSYVSYKKVLSSWKFNNASF